MRRGIVLLCVFFTVVPHLDARQIRRAGILFDSLHAKEGWVANGLPSINYNIDLGLEYGATLEFFQYGESSRFPVYDQFFSLKSFHTTRGTSSYQFKWDNKSLLSSHRIIADVGYFTDQALGFYGFNGASSVYNRAFEDEDEPDHISRMYYRQARKLWNIKLDMQTPLNVHTRFFYGVGFQSFEMGTVDVDRINTHRNMGSHLPDTTLLFDQYVAWGIIPHEHKYGGKHGVLRLGLVFDTRPVDIAPSSGIWSEVLLMAAPSVPDLSVATYLKLAMTHRQYIRVFHPAVFAYRLSYQPLLYGDMPYYAMPFLYFSDYSVSALGGHNSLRGVIRNRIVGQGYLLGNFELRMTLFHFLLGERFEVQLTLKPFLDAGMVTQAVRFEVPEEEKASLHHFSGDKEKLHYSYGLGGHIAINRNFIISADLGFSPDPNNGPWGFYLGTGYRF